MPGSESAEAHLSLADVFADPGEPGDPEPRRPRHHALQERFLADVVPLPGPFRRPDFGPSAFDHDVAVPQLAAPGADEWGEPLDAGSIVRPYMWTRGRTRPVQDLALEALVSLAQLPPGTARPAAPEHHAILGLCARPVSVAELAALLALPLGVVRVLLADMIDTGWLRVHETAAEAGGAPDLDLLRRVLDGLHRL